MLGFATNHAPITHATTTLAAIVHSHHARIR